MGSYGDMFQKSALDIDQHIKDKYGANLLKIY